jgi:hypothetical protein
VENRDLATIVTVSELKSDGSHEYQWKMRSSIDGLDLVDDRFQVWDRPVCWLKLPHKDGNTWEAEVQVKPKDANVEFDELWKFQAYGPEEVQVPAGTFKAIRVHSYRVQFPTSERTIWYAPGVGMVKQEDSSGPAVRPGKSWAVLYSFTPGKG